MSAGTIWGFTAGAVLFTFLTILAIPTINWYNGNGFKLLRSGSSKSDNNSDDKKKLTDVKEGNDEKEIDTRDFFNDEERRELYSTLMWIKDEYDKKLVPGNLLTYYKNQENGKVVFVRGYKMYNDPVPCHMLRYMIRLNRKEEVGDLNDEFEFEDGLTPEEIEEMVFKNHENSRELRQLQYKYTTLLRLQERIGAYVCESDGRGWLNESGVIDDCDDKRLAELDVTEELPCPEKILPMALKKD